MTANPYIPPMARQWSLVAQWIVVYRAADRERRAAMWAMQPRLQLEMQAIEHEEGYYIVQAGKEYPR